MTAYTISWPTELIVKHLLVVQKFLWWAVFILFQDWKQGKNNYWTTHDLSATNFMLSCLKVLFTVFTLIWVRPAVSKKLFLSIETTRLCWRSHKLSTNNSNKKWYYKIVDSRQVEISNFWVTGQQIGKDPVTSHKFLGKQLFHLRRNMLFQLQSVFGLFSGILRSQKMQKPLLVKQTFETLAKCVRKQTLWHNNWVVVVRRVEPFLMKNKNNQLVA